MDDCQRTAERLTPYTDAALPPGERDEVERHLGKCPPCRQSAAAEQGGRAIVRGRAEQLRQTPLPPGLRSRCETLARKHCQGRRSILRGRLIPAIAMATAAGLAILAVFSFATRQSGTLLAAQLAADHAKCFQLFAPAGEADALDVERQLRAQYGWDIDVPPSSEEHGLQLVGGRRCLYGEGTMPHVMYRAADETPVSLFRMDGVTREEAEVITMGYRCRIWSRGGHTYALVTPESGPERTARIAEYVRTQAR